MPKKVTVIAPAKINLTLDIAGRRQDGYHLLKTVMQAVGLHDTITITATNTGRIDLICDRPGVPTDETGLCHRATAAFFAYTRLPMTGLEIALQCDIPTEGGLGSASADAAGVLVGLNHLYNAKLPTDTLCELGVGLGADVPFGIVGGAMLAEGIGEVFTPVPLLPDCAIVIAKPEQGAKTAECFAAYDRMGVSALSQTQRLVTALQSGQLQAVADCLSNALEQACGVSQVQQLKGLMLEHGALGASMTGSGTAVFGLFDNPTQAQKAAKALQQQAAFVTVTHPIAGGAYALAEE